MTSRFAAFATMLTTGILAAIHVPLALVAYGLRNTSSGLTIDMTVNGLDMSAYADTLLVYAVMAFSAALTVAIWAAARYDALTEQGGGQGGAGRGMARGASAGRRLDRKRGGDSAQFTASPAIGWAGSSLEH